MSMEMTYSSTRPREVRLWWPLPLAVLVWLLIIWVFGFFLSESEVDVSISIPDAIEAEFLELPSLTQPQEPVPPPRKGIDETPAEPVPPPPRPRPLTVRSRHRSDKKRLKPRPGKKRNRDATKSRTRRANRFVRIYQSAQTATKSPCRHF